MSPPPAKLNVVGGGGPGGVAAGAWPTRFTARVAARTGPVRVRVRNRPNVAFMLPPPVGPDGAPVNRPNGAARPYCTHSFHSPPNGKNLPDPGKDHPLFAWSAGW